MNRSRAVALALLGLILLAAQSAGSDTDVQVVDVSNHPLIRIVFTPPDDARGRELATEDVALTQNDVPVSEFILRALDAEPVEAVLVIDTSGSMRGAPLAAAKEAAKAFVDQLPPGSDIAVVAFGNDVEVVAVFGADPAELENAIDGLIATGETSLYDAVIEAVGIVDSGPRSRQFIIALSDGGDTASTGSLADATTALASIDLGFYAVTLPGSEFDPTAMREMADISEGTMVEAANTAALADVYADIAIEVSSQYAVVFETATGGETTFQLTVSTPSGPSTDRFTVELPAVSVAREPGPAASTTTVAPPEIVLGTSRVFTPPPIRLVTPAGPLQQPWAKTVGIGALTVVFALAFALALKPQEEARQRRHGVFDSSQDGPTGDDGFLSRLRGMATERMGKFEEKRIDKGGTSVNSALDAAGVALKPGEFALMSLVGAMLGFLLGSALGSLILAVILSIGAIGAPRIWLRVATDRRRAAFADQLEGTLQLIAGSLRAGYGIGQAINTVATESADPTQSEFSRVVVETRLGRDSDESLRAMASRMSNQDLQWVIEAIEIQRGVGGDLAEVLDKVGGTIRDRNQIRRQVQALTAEGRLSAIILIALPFVIAGFVEITNPAYLNDLTGTTPGRIMLASGAVLMTIGIVWIRNLIKIEF